MRHNLRKFNYISWKLNKVLIKKIWTKKKILDYHNKFIYNSNSIFSWSSINIKTVTSFGVQLLYTVHFSIKGRCKKKCNTKRGRGNSVTPFQYEGFL